MSDLILDIPNNLSKSLCNQIIERFEKDARISPGWTGGGFHPEMKTSIDLMFSRYEDWDDITKLLDYKLKENIASYDEFLSTRIPPNVINVRDVWHSGYQIQKSGHYRWHHDCRIEYGRERFLTFIWYLNTIEEGGETGFLYKKVKPETGKFVLFPATWDYIHCGFDSNSKYIVTGWLWKEVPPV